MTDKDDRPIDPAALRQKAEDFTMERVARPPENSAALAPEDIQKTLHELRVHQIKLEMQNEELRRAQAEVEAARTRYFNFYDLAPVGHCSLSEAGLILEANLTAATLLATPRSALVKQPLSRFIFKEDLDIDSLHRKQLFETGEPQKYDLRLLKPDGASFWAHLMVTAAQAEDGTPVSRVVISDIAERKLAEEQIRFQADILDNSPGIAAYHDSDLNVVWVNKAYQKATGLTLEDVRGKKCYQVWNLSGPCRGCPVITAIETGEKAAHELTPDNQDHWPETQGCWLSQASPVRDEHGTIIGAIEFAIDITARKWAEIYNEMRREIPQILNQPGDLQSSLQRILAVLKKQTGVDAVGLRLQKGEDFPYFVENGFPADFLLTENTLVERNMDGGVCRDKNGNVNLECTCGLVLSGQTDPTNPLFTKGGSCWINDSLPLLDLPSDQDPRRRPRNNCIHQGYASVALIPVRTSDRIVGLIQLNDKRKGRFTLETVEILEGIAAHIGSALMRKQAEAEQEKLQAQLNQAQKMESVGRLAGGVAHDFNNMLAVIIGHADMVLRKMDPDQPFYADLMAIRTAGRRSADLTRQLLAFARKQTIAPKVIDLNETIVSMLKMLERLIGEDIDLAWRPSKEAWTVNMDPTQIDQILANLCVNARDAIAGVGKLTIETGQASISTEDCRRTPSFVPGDYVLLVVSDSGCGMDTETLSHLFEPFFTTKELGQGTGLGLATVYGVVKQNHGFINVYSEPGQGTTFKIYLPRYLAKEELATKDNQRPAAARGSEVVLLVEDEPALLVMFTMMLEQLGYTVLGAGTPGAAICLAREHAGNIQLLISDVVMPEMNGRDLAKNLLSIYPHLTCLFMSGYTANVIAHHGVLDEGVNFIQKPFSVDDMATKVREVLDRE